MDFKEWYYIYGRELWITIGVSILIIAFFALLIFGPKLLEKQHASNYSESKQGKILSVKEKFRLSQGLTGNNAVIDGFNIKYSFKVSDEIYIDSSYIKKASLMPKQVNALIYLDTTKAYTVKFDGNNPTKSRIVIE